MSGPITVTGAGDSSTQGRAVTTLARGLDSSDGQPPRSKPSNSVRKGVTADAAIAFGTLQPAPGLTRPKTTGGRPMGATARGSCGRDPAGLSQARRGTRPPSVRTMPTSTRASSAAVPSSPRHRQRNVEVPSRKSEVVLQRLIPSDVEGHAVQPTSEDPTMAEPDRNRLKAVLLEEANGVRRLLVDHNASLVQG